MRKLRFSDLEFATIPVTQYSDQGTPWIKEVPVGMPKLPNKALDCVCYLYRSAEDARAGQEFGGTGFLISVPVETVKDRIFLYVVTNWHVAVRDGFSVIRLNTHEGGVDIFEFGPEDWTFDPRYDIAVIPIALNKDIHKYAYIGIDAVLTQEKAEEVGIGPGEDVFMIGRFVDHDGGVTNQPTVRFGNISTYPTTIKQPSVGNATAYCIDMHSRSGYSGSPVFAYRTPGYDLGEMPGKGENKALLLSGVNLLMLLGIHFAQFPEKWEIIKLQENKGISDDEARSPLIIDGDYVKGLSGMTCVLPAWTIKEVLKMPMLQIRRAVGRIVEIQKQIKEAKIPEAESAPPTKGENPQHKEDFNSLLDAAVRGPKQDR